MKNIRVFYLKIFSLEVKFSIYLNGRVFVIIGFYLSILTNRQNQTTNGPVAHLRQFVLNKLMVTFLKNETS